MTGKPPPRDVGAAARNAEGNPVFRMLGLPRIRRIKLPSRNWLIFLSFVGSWTTALTYDRYHKKRAQRKWCDFVSHLAEETIPPRTMPRRITILLAAPPGDGLRVAREHFHEYVKPILVAGALDWEVIEGRREGEVRAGLAEKIRKMRERNGEQRTQEQDTAVSQQEAIDLVRHTLGTEEWAGVKGDLIIGRHTWKEYIRGLHEGWLGPIDVPAPPKSVEVEETLQDSPSPTAIPSESPSVDEESTLPEDKPPEPAEKPVSKPLPTPAYISPSSYASSTLAPTCPLELSPSTAIPLPHILGFLNTPKRMYRFLNRRHMADSTGASVAALVLAAHTRSYNHGIDNSPTISDVDDASPTATHKIRPSWEQETVLGEAEPEWHKSARKASEEGDERERTWKEEMMIDARIGERMRTFELLKDSRTRAEEMEEKNRREKEPLWVTLKNRAGYGPKKKGGWDMGLEGEAED